MLVCVVGAAHPPRARSLPRVTLPLERLSDVPETAAPVAEVTGTYDEREGQGQPAEVPAVVQSDADVFGPVVAPAPAPVSKSRKYPREGGKCWQVWNACDELLAAGTHPTVAHLRAHAIEHNWNVSNASQEFYAWRKFHGRK